MSDRVFELRRVVALVGPFGSGKTELSVALARLAAAGLAARTDGVTRVALADLDVIKPYFRSRETAERLARDGIGLLAPKGALAEADLPILTPELRGNVARQDVQVILDVGGDPVGARALGSIADVVGAADHDVLLVLNKNRPFMESVESVVAHLGYIVGAAGLSPTGVISNTHMLEETTLADVEDGLVFARAVAAALGVPVRLVGIPAALAPALVGREDLPPAVVIHRQMMPEFLGGVVLRRPAHRLQTGSDA